MPLTSGTHRRANLIGECLKSVRANTLAGRPSHHLGALIMDADFKEEGASGHSASVLNNTQKRGEQMTGLLDEGQQLERARAC
jgi:hypothetical protein